ncbi:MAG TPA: hypothetical protein VGR06_26665 [Actinophytocola sp.]|jgi:hypothetical protein|nr:hypothetical protein [Actinophytocola sp.]
MSITSKITAATAGIATAAAAFAIFAMGAGHSAESRHPNPARVVADSHWGEPSPAPTPIVTDDSHWG